jgi:hypothetical protein
MNTEQHGFLDAALRDPQDAGGTTGIPQAARLPRCRFFSRHITLHCRVLFFFIPLMVLGGGGEIKGRLTKDSFTAQNWIEDLEQYPPKTEDELCTALSLAPERIPVPKTKVTLLWRDGQRTVNTDAEGNFHFPGLSRGRYELVAKKDKLTAHSNVVLNHRKSRFADLRFTPMHASIQGRITDTEGKPVKNALIKAVYHNPRPEYQSYLENHEAAWWTAISDRKGFYELTGLDTANHYHLAGFLVAKKGCRSFVKIHVEASGLEQESIPQVPLITEEVLGLSRRMLNVFKQMPGSEAANLTAYGLKPVSPSQVFKLWQNLDLETTTEIPVPASNGNTITGMDIVLKKPTPGDEHGRAPSPTTETN